MQNHCADMPFLVAAGFSLLYPPDWIPASAGMTEEGVRLRRTGGLVVDSPQDEGCPPSLFVSSPKIEDPPQEEWGIKGV